MNTSRKIFKGMLVTKDAVGQKQIEDTLALLSKQVGDITDLVKKSKDDQDAKYRELTNEFGGVKASTEEQKATVAQKSAEYAELVNKHNTLVATLDSLKKEMDAPILKGGNDRKDRETELAIELQRRVFVSKGVGEAEDFKPDTSNLVDISAYRGAVRKMMQVGLVTKEQAVRSLSDIERKAFDAASLDQGFFLPEMLGIEVDCNIICSSLEDLYANVNVSKSTFRYPKINDYGDLGSYQCDAKCDAELGPEGNLQWLEGRTFDFRGVFCFQKKILQEANYNLLDFMMRAAARSHRINRNRVLISGDGVNEPLGWARNDCFTKLKTGALKFDHQWFRRFMSSAPVEYGNVVATMHQNVFAYLASAVDNNGRFIFGDGQMTFSPDDTSERIRISNCLPDATAGGTRGSTASPFVAGDFLVAAGNWEKAYTSVSKKPLFMEQWMGQTTAWCVKYQFGAEDGGFVTCCPAARILTVGA